MSQPENIVVTGARQHNLKSLNTVIPLNQITVITGVSGSGKSSLAFDTLYAEGQRRYVESFSAYARQFLQRMDRPDVDGIEGVLPAVAIDQKNHIRSARSTVGTITEVADYLKLLYARASTLHCDGCGEKVQAQDAAFVADSLFLEHADEQVIIGFPFDPSTAGDSEIAEAYLRGRGYFRIIAEDNKVVRLDDTGLASLPPSPVIVIQDRVRIVPSSRARLMEAVEAAMREGEGHVEVVAGDARLHFTNLLHCEACDIRYGAPTPSLFSFNTPVGACDKCNGFGRVIDIDMDLVVPDHRLSIQDGAIAAWSTKRASRERSKLRAYCAAAGIDNAVPWSELTSEQRTHIVDGDKAHRWRGIKGWFNRIKRKSYKMHVRVFLARYRGYFRCDKCDGARYCKDALRWRIGDLNIAGFSACPLTDALDRLDNLELSEMMEHGVKVVLDELLSRLRYLIEVGLGYLTLDRPSRSLSGGEVQRVNLTTALGSQLVGTLYVLDEPSVGLHSRDNARLLGVLRKIRDLGNTVVLVEHDEAIIRGADNVIDLGPHAGEAGGQIIYEGKPSGLLKSKKSVTAQYLNREQQPLRVTNQTFEHYVSVNSATANNLKGINVQFPVGAVSCVTGVSGSGKSTLVVDTLYKSLRRLRGQPTESPGSHNGIDGHERFDQIVLVDASPVATSPRSNPATYMKAWSPIRTLFSKQEAAIRRGFSPSTFSFNTGNGRCDACDGSGHERVEMQFLSDLFLTCDACQGTRFKREVRQVLVREKSVDQVLDLTVADACEFFEDVRPIVRALQPLLRVGLGYLRLGQPLSTLSGGEAQRLKLADGLRQLGRSAKETLYILDEPTTGLHLRDVEILTGNLRELADAGHTIIVIEHHLDVIRTADYVLDLGPEGGAQGGNIVTQGSPDVIAAHADSHTGYWLREGMKPPTPRRALEPPKAEISVRGARVHNLKEVSLTLPRGQMAVVTGPSGSGKSSLAFDVLFAEGQRRFIDCLSPYARQYLPQAARPDLDELVGIPPTVAIEQRTTRFGRLSTVATVTEIYHFLRLLYARVGRQHCHLCGSPVQGLSVAELHSQIVAQHSNQRIMVLAPVVKRRKGWHKDVIKRATKLGVPMVRIDGGLRAAKADIALERYQEHDIDYVTLADHLVTGRKGSRALKDAIELALVEGHGTCYVRVEATGDETIYSLDLYCSACSVGFDAPDPRLFSFRGKHSGACEFCEGTGVDDADVSQKCGQCDGSRLSSVSRAVLVGEYGIDRLCAMTSGQLLEWLDNLTLLEREAIIAESIVRELSSRCRFLVSVGLDYLTLDRSGATLSGGESQRVRLAAQLASQLSGVLYVLDEPTIGLHPRDNDRLLDALMQLRGRGNTVVVVEHDQATIDRADIVVDLGPCGGRNGGQIVAIGTPAEIRKNPDSLTGRWLTVPEHPARPNRPEPTLFLKLTKAQRNNLDNLSVRFPRGRLTVVTGVSGSGKTTLVRDVLEPRLREVVSGASVDGLSGGDDVRRVIEVDQSPIGRTPRSVPATYIGIMDPIRKLFAQLPEAQIRGYKPSRFSFNVKGGRCEGCAGQGAVNLEMAFLPNAYVPCEICSGRRYNTETLRVMYRGHTISDVLSATVDEACEIFDAHPKIYKALELTAALGLGYLTLGQASNTLSGGEAQRIKLVSELRKRSMGDTVYLLDEPSTGLHMSDLARLLTVIQQFVDRGDTVIVIEHNLDFVAAADWVVDLGPEGGVGGGQLVFEGAPEQLLDLEQSQGHTAKFFKQHQSDRKNATCVYNAHVVAS